MENSITESFIITNEYILLSLWIINISGVVLNVLLLVAFITDPLKCFRNSGTYLLMNLSLSDCLSSIFYLFHTIKITPFLTTIAYFLLFCTGGVSLISLTSISIDRFLIVAYPIKHRILMKGKLMILWIVAIWLVSCVISVSEMLSKSTRGRQALYSFGVILIILSLVMYWLTYYKLKKQWMNTALQNSTESRAQEIRIIKEKQFLKTIVIIACIAFVCAVSPMFMSVIHYCQCVMVYNSATKIAIILSRVLLCVNFAVNPLIYILRLPSYHRTFYLLYCRRRTASR